MYAVCCKMLNNCKYFGSDYKFSLAYNLKTLKLYFNIIFYIKKFSRLVISNILNTCWIFQASNFYTYYLKKIVINKI